MSAKVFLDSNILLYACSAAAEDAPKQQIAANLISQDAFALSTQVLQEFIAIALKKPKLGITEAQIDATLELASLVLVQELSYPLILKAVTLRRRHQLSHWDASIVAAALELGCQTLYSEDLNHGQIIEGLQIVNPFSS